MGNAIMDMIINFFENHVILIVSVAVLLVIIRFAIKSSKWYKALDQVLGENSGFVRDVRDMRLILKSLPTDTSDVSELKSKK